METLSTGAPSPHSKSPPSSRLYLTHHTNHRDTMPTPLGSWNSALCHNSLLRPRKWSMTCSYLSNSFKTELFIHRREENGKRKSLNFKANSFPMKYVFMLDSLEIIIFTYKKSIYILKWYYTIPIRWVFHSTYIFLLSYILIVYVINFIIYYHCLALNNQQPFT